MAGKKRDASEWRGLVIDLATAYTRATKQELPADLARRVADVLPRRAGRRRQESPSEKKVTVAVLMHLYLERGPKASASEVARVMHLADDTVSKYYEETQGEISQWLLLHDIGVLSLIEPDEVVRGVTRALRSVTASGDDFEDLTQPDSGQQ